MIRQDIRVRFGVDKNVDHFIGTGPELRVTAEVADGATLIPVQALKRAIPNGSKVRFGVDNEAGLVVTLTAEAKVGALSLAVSAISGLLHPNDRGRQCQDVSGWTLVANYQLPAATAIVLAKAVTIQTATEGHVRQALTDTELGTTLNENSFFYELRQTVPGQDVVAFGAFEIERF